MLKKLIKLTAIVLILFLLPTANIQASGKMEVKLGEKVTLQGDSVDPGSVYKWTVKKDKEIINTQTSPIFNYTFVEQGEYDVALLLTDTEGGIKTTSISILAGDKYERPVIIGEETVPPEKMPLSISYSTLPSLREDGAVHLIGDGKVLFNIEVTRDDILEYRIDRNIFEDSDGNGVANDDIDNANDSSYLLGGVWETEYRIGEATKIVAEITLVSKEGEKTKAQVEILFDDVTHEGDPVAVLEVTPSPDPEDQLVHLYDDKSAVAFYSRASKGKILEYRIDKNIFKDSNGDGDPANDVDNVNDISFKTGDVWQTQYEKTDDQIIAQLIVVGEGGKGSRVQRGIWFTDKPKPPAITEIKNAIRLTADKAFVVKGDPINFTVEGLTQAFSNYTFAWDFDGNGETDKEIEADNTASYIYDFAGVYTVMVTVTDKQGNAADFTMDVVVKDAVTTTADFDFAVEGNTARFTNKSVVDLKLADKTLNYTWDFGDTDPAGYEKQKDQTGASDPAYTYNKAGTYIVTLTVTDADQIADTKTAEVSIEKDLTVPAEEVTQVTGETPVIQKEGQSIIVKILKAILYLILIIIVLVVLIVLGFMVFLKVQNPDLMFEELVDEIKIKILGMLGVHEMLMPTSPDGDQIEKPIEEDEEHAKEPAEEAPLAKESGPVPSWMKEAAKPSAVSPQPSVKEPMPETEIEEGEEAGISEEDKSDNNKPPKKGGGTPSLSEQSGPVPDWLKGA
jgi:PKD repeat protein